MNIAKRHIIRRCYHSFRVGRSEKGVCALRAIHWHIWAKKGTYREILRTYICLFCSLRSYIYIYIYIYERVTEQSRFIVGSTSPQEVVPEPMCICTENGHGSHFLFIILCHMFDALSLFWLPLLFFVYIYICMCVCIDTYCRCTPCSYNVHIAKLLY